MSKDWDYAELSKNASNSGGPKEYIRSIREESFNEGKTKGTLLGITSCLVIAIGGFVVNKFRKVFKQNETKKLEETAAYDKKVMDQLYMDLRTNRKVEEEEKIAEEGDKDE